MSAPGRQPGNDAAWASEFLPERFSAPGDETAPTPAAAAAVPPAETRAGRSSGRNSSSNNTGIGEALVGDIGAIRVPEITVRTVAVTAVIIKVVTSVVLVVLIGEVTAVTLTIS